MDLTSFHNVVKYQIQSRSMKHFFMPAINVINAVKEYNIIRASSAKKLVTTITNNVLVDSIRKSSKIVQIDSVSPFSKCCISKINLSDTNGITLIIYVQDKPSIFCIHQRFLIIVHKYFNIVHFDDEMYKLFKSWTLKKFTTVDFINKNNIENVSNKFLEYNNSSNVNLLYVKFNSVCEI